jgi:hypothetical protein
MKWNILSFLLLLAAPYIRAQTVTATFKTPNQACTGEPISINNTSTSATTYHWNFCAPNTNVPPAMQNLGNFNGLLDQPVFMDYVHTGNDYYAFVTNYKTGNLVRLDFGNSLLNTPRPLTWAISVARCPLYRETVACKSYKIMANGM